MGEMVVAEWVSIFIYIFVLCVSHVFLVPIRHPQIAIAELLID